jgi:chromatin remodeling complex protein RSC6
MSKSVKSTPKVSASKKEVKAPAVKEAKASVKEVKVPVKTPAKASKVPAKSAKKEEVVLEVVAEGETVKAVRTRRVVNRDTVLECLAAFQELIDKEATKSNTKFVRSVNKRVRMLRGYLSRVLKQKGSKNPNANTNRNSGFLKPVAISTDMATFTGWSPDKLRSRVEVTTALCNYIKENDLQNPADRRQIIPDPKLAKLLSYDSSTAEQPLTYYRMQSLMKDHFLKHE